ncbi:MAG: amidase, partial [Thermodesulfobacteriota bacterium]
LNPWNPAHTPGGSSSGSAAAVADGMVPLAIGTQTNGSVIRPASYCGVIGFKPTHGLISRTGVLHQSWHLDQVGVFSNSIEDAALAAETLMTFDQADPSMKPFARPRLLDATASASIDRKIAFVRSPVWENAEPSTRQAFEKLAGNLGNVEAVKLPKVFDEAVEMHRTIMEADFGLSFHDLFEQNRNSLSPMLRGTIERGKTITAVSYNRAVQGIARLNQELENVFSEYDAILSPATPSSAPEGLETTGSPIFCTIWTLLGLPAVSLPLLKNEKGLPLGVQLVGRRLEDARLLAAANGFIKAAGFPSGSIAR